MLRYSNQRGRSPAPQQTVKEWRFSHQGAKGSRFELTERGPHQRKRTSLQRKQAYVSPAVHRLLKVLQGTTRPNGGKNFGENAREISTT